MKEEGFCWFCACFDPGFYLFSSESGADGQGAVVRTVKWDEKGRRRGEQSWSFLCCAGRYGIFFGGLNEIYGLFCFYGVFEVTEGGRGGGGRIAG